MSVTSHIILRTIVITAKNHKYFQDYIFHFFASWGLDVMSHSPASFPRTEGASQQDVLTPWKTFSVFFWHLRLMMGWSVKKYHYLYSCVLWEKQDPGSLMFILQRLVTSKHHPDCWCLRLWVFFQVTPRTQLQNLNLAPKCKLWKNVNYTQQLGIKYENAFLLARSNWRLEPFSSVCIRTEHCTLMNNKISLFGLPLN